ncbi:soma ferritin [Lingula anatina]|uniref:Ferritin n=1 Tax=Lingula anatina TaxID=7574 RepID=A0A2R2MTS1_LINAN|nr:soma ferritin [Lingula anatina]|eukprot:XP_023933523.1 soma ferritin [Lingula anatina]
MALSLPRQNYHSESEAGVNKQINLNYYASYVYHSLAWHFDRDDVALKGFHEFFKEASGEKREHACKLMKFQNQRGGRVVLQDIKKPDLDEWGDGANAMKAVLALEKNVNQAWLDLHKIAQSHVDPEAWHFDDDLKGFFKFFKEASDEKRNHAGKLSHYQNTRGGRIVLKDIKAPDFKLSNGLNAMEAALGLERILNQSWLDAHKTATKFEDAEMKNWIETEFLHHEVAFIKTICDHITNSKRVGPGLGEYLFDKETLQE